jgi:hypothetical protein
MLLAAPASAAEVYVHTATIGSLGTGNGQLTLGAHSAVVVNGAVGDVYVADTGNGRVEEFEADGTFVRVFGSFASPAFLAIDESGVTPTGDVYVADTVAGTVSKFAPDGSPISTWGTGGQLVGFASLSGIAVGPDGDLYVLDGQTVHRFDPATGSPVVAPFETLFGTTPIGFAVDPEEHLYKAAGGEIAKFSNTGSVLAESLDARNDATAFSIDPNSGDLYVTQKNQGNPIVTHFALNCGNRCAPVESFGLNELSSPSGIAIGPAGVRYVADAGTSTIKVFTLATVELPVAIMGPVSAITGTSAHLSGEVNPNGFPTSCKFQVVTDARFAESGFAQATSVPCAANPGSGSSLVPVEADANGLTAGTTYHVRLEASNPAGPNPSAEATFTTEPIPPVIDGQSIIAVGLTEATVGATIDPGSAATTYHFEFLDEAAFEAEGFASRATRSTPEFGPLPADNAGHEVSATLTGLEPNTTYFFRVVATNAVGSVAGFPPPKFKTQAQTLLPGGECPNQALRTGFASLLPNCRAYEQVTPVDKGGLYIEGFADMVGAAPDGSAVTYISGLGSGFPASGGGRQETTTFLASSAGGSWSSQRLFPPEQYGEKAGFLGASGNMRFVLVEAGNVVPGKSPAIKPGLFLIDTVTQAVTQIVPYQSEAPEDGVTFAYDAISNDGSRVFFESQIQLTEEAAPGWDNLYMWDRATGDTSLVGLLPSTEGGNAPPAGSFAGAYAWYDEETTKGGTFKDLYVEAVNAASSDGDQIYFTAGGTGQIYLRRGLAGSTPVTVKVSKANEGVEDPIVEEAGEEFPAAFQEATPDGSRAFFISSQKLTADASTGPSDVFGKDLYRYDEQEGKLVDITGNRESATNPNGMVVEGLLGASTDGSSGYFAAKGAVDGGTAGKNNIYRFEEDGPGHFTLTFVATTDEGALCNNPSGARNWAPSSYCGPKIADYVGKSSRVTSNGQTLVFTKDANIYDYNAASEEVTCISCLSTEAPSAGEAELTAGFFNANQFAIPNVLPAPRLTENVSADGTRVFFQTPNSLVAEDANGTPNCGFLIDNPLIGKKRPLCVDVYEWEAPGAPGGSCTKAEVNGGCLYLLSTGKSNEASYFLDASSDGRSVFIATTDQLVPVDRDDLYDVYNVRVDGGIASQHVLPGVPCTDESCRGAATVPPSSSTAGTSSFNGPGNPKPQKPKKPKPHKHKKHKKKQHKKHKQGNHKNGHGRSGKGGRK